MRTRRRRECASADVTNRAPTSSREEVSGIAGQARQESALFRDLLGGRLVLVENPHLDVARRLVAQILLAMDGAARNIIPVAGLEHLRRLSLDGEGDVALLDRGPLVAGMAM